jgi:hypothetical protein
MSVNLQEETYSLLGRDRARPKQVPESLPMKYECFEIAGNTVRGASCPNSWTIWLKGFPVVRNAMQHKAYVTGILMPVWELLVHAYGVSRQGGPAIAIPATDRIINQHGVQSWANSADPWSHGRAICHTAMRRSKIS